MSAGCELKPALPAANNILWQGMHIICWQSFNIELILLFDIKKPVSGSKMDCTMFAIYCMRLLIVWGGGEQNIVGDVLASVLGGGITTFTHKSLTPKYWPQKLCICMCVGNGYIFYIYSECTCVKHSKYGHPAICGKCFGGHQHPLVAMWFPLLSWDAALCITL